MGESGYEGGSVGDRVDSPEFGDVEACSEDGAVVAGGEAFDPAAEVGDGDCCVGGLAGEEGG